MNLRMYYEKIHECEGRLAEEFTVLVSLETPDGGKPGVRTEAPRGVAARMIVEGRARLATAPEIAEFRAAQAAAKEEADRVAAAAKMQVAVLAAADLEKLRGGKAKV